MWQAWVVPAPLPQTESPLAPCPACNPRHYANKLVPFLLTFSNFKIKASAVSLQKCSFVFRNAFTEIKHLEMVNIGLLHSEENIAC